MLLTGEGYIDTNVIPLDLSLPENASSEISGAKDLKSSFEEKERRLIIKTLEEVKFNKSKAAWADARSNGSGNSRIVSR